MDKESPFQVEPTYTEINSNFHNMHEVDLVKDNNQNENKESSFSNLSKKQIDKKKLFIYKDLLVISFAFLLLFTAFQALQGLQSSMNSDAGIGTLSLAIIYGIIIFGNLFYGPFIVIRVGCKYTLVVCILLYCTYIAANFKAEYYYITLIIGAILLGSAGAPLWTALSTYVNTIGMIFAELTNENPLAIIPRFFGIFAFLFQSAQIWGNLIAYAVLDQPKANSSNDLSICGSIYCEKSNSNASNNSNLERPPDYKVYQLCSIYLGCGIAASFFILLFLGNRKTEEKSKAKLNLKMLAKTLELAITDGRQTLLIVITIYTGLETGFIMSDFTSAFVKCSWGTGKIGLVMLSFGVCNCLGSLFFGVITKWVGRIFIITLAAIMNTAILFLLIWWKPHPDYSYVFFIVASIWGAGDAIWQSQMSALYGNVFSEDQEAGFSNKGVWESLGFVIAYAYSSYLCVITKIYVLFTFLGIGMPLYYGAEFLDYKKKHSKQAVEILRLKHLKDNT